jgi:DnaK suppressor protein
MSFSKRDIEELKQLLLQQRNYILQAQQDLTIEEHQNHPDDIDMSVQASEKTMAMRLKSRETLYLKKIKESLEEIENGTYGICQECEESISKQRLLARPTARECVECKEILEKKENSSIVGRQPKSAGPSFKFK